MAIVGLTSFLVLPVALMSSNQALVARSTIENSRASIRIGQLRQGETREIAVELVNPYAHGLTVDRVDCASRCLEPKAMPWRMEAGAERTVEFTINLSKQPDFTGTLSMRILASSAQYGRVFELQIDARVIAAKTGGNDDE